jgi:peptide/nickel transport system ATP-binding protein
MYAGRLVETGTVREVLRARRHPYTRGLLASTVHGGMRGRDLDMIPGNPPSLAELPPGCAFAPRCKEAIESCHRTAPPAVRINDGAMVRCILAAPALDYVEAGVPA